MPIIEATHGAYTAEQLHRHTSFEDVLMIWEAVCFKGAGLWIDREPKTYDVPLTPEIVAALRKEE